MREVGSFTVRVPTVAVHCENGVKNTERNVFWEKLKVVKCRCWCYVYKKNVDSKVSAVVRRILF